MGRLGTWETDINVLANDGGRKLVLAGGAFALHPLALQLAGAADHGSTLAGALFPTASHNDGAASSRDRRPHAAASS